MKNISLFSNCSEIKKTNKNNTNFLKQVLYQNMFFPFLKTLFPGYKLLKLQSVSKYFYSFLNLLLLSSIVLVSFHHLFSLSRVSQITLLNWKIRLLWNFRKNIKEGQFIYVLMGTSVYIITYNVVAIRSQMQTISNFQICRT